MQKNLKIILNFTLILSIFFTTNCGLYKKVDKTVPISGEERARKNIEEGRGISIGNLGKNSTNYEFSSSNPMWRATLEIIDFLPLTTVDYSGGIIITDWYSNRSGSNNSEELKITIRFLSNEIGASNLKIIVHQKKCKALNDCDINEINTKIKDELINRILTLASSIEKKNKSKN